MNVDVNITALMPLILLFVGIAVTIFMGVMPQRIKPLSGVVAALTLVLVFWDLMSRVLPAMVAGPLSMAGGMLHYNHYSVFLSILVLMTGIGAFILSEQYLREEDFAHPEYHALLLSSVAGMLIMLNTTNMLNIFIGLEILSIPLYTTVAYLRYRESSVEGGLKYFVLGAIASGFLAYGIALIYGGTVSLQFDAIRMADQGDSLFRLGLLFLMVGLAFKASAVPFHVWTPDAYEGAPTPVTAFMSIAPKAVAIGVLLRLMYMVFPQMENHWRESLVVLSILTVVVGNVAAIVQHSVKRMLAYSSIAHAGYLMMGIVAFSEEGVSGVLFYLAGYMLINTGAFGILTMLKAGDEEHVTLDDIRGLGYRYPWMGIFMSVFMFSLAGMPATVGFMGKFYVFKALIHANYLWLALIGIGGSLVSVYYYLRVVVQMYMKESPDEHAVTQGLLPMTLMLLCSVLIISAGLFPGRLADYATLAARLMN